MKDKLCYLLAGKLCFYGNEPLDWSGSKISISTPLIITIALICPTPFHSFILFLFLQSPFTFCRFFVDVSCTKDRRFVTINSSSKTTSEVCISHYFVSVSPHLRKIIDVCGGQFAPFSPWRFFHLLFCMSSVLSVNKGTITPSLHIGLHIGFCRQHSLSATCSSKGAWYRILHRALSWFVLHSDELSRRWQLSSMKFVFVIYYTT